MSVLDALPFARLPNGDLVPHSEYSRQLYLLIDAEALRIGEDIRTSHPAPAELRDYAKTAGLSPWLSETNRNLADAIEQDVRLAALPALSAWVQSGKSGAVNSAFLNWYRCLLRAHIDMQRADQATLDRVRVVMAAAE